MIAVKAGAICTSDDLLDNEDEHESVAPFIVTNTMAQVDVAVDAPRCACRFNSFSRCLY